MFSVPAGAGSQDSLPGLGIAQTGVFLIKLLVLTNLGGLGVIILATLVGSF
jgi:hypothetical protein